MNARNSSDAASRRAVAERLRRFFADLTTQLAAGPAEIWRTVERRRAEKSPDTERGRDVGPPSGFRQMPMQQQQQQQQQPKAKPEDGK